MAVFGGNLISSPPQGMSFSSVEVLIKEAVWVCPRCGRPRMGKFADCQLATASPSPVKMQVTFSNTTSILAGKESQNVSIALHCVPWGRASLFYKYHQSPFSIPPCPKASLPS